MVMAAPASAVPPSAVVMPIIPPLWTVNATPVVGRGQGMSGVAVLVVAGRREVHRVEGDHREQLVGRDAALQDAVRIGDEALDAAAVAAGALDQLQGARVDEQRALVDVPDAADGEHGGRAGVAAGEGEDVADRHEAVAEPQPAHWRCSCRLPAATSVPTCSTHQRNPLPSTRSWGSRLSWRRCRDARTWSRLIDRIRATRIRYPA